MKIAVAMSGGVDSSVAAHILKSAVHDVFGLTMRIWSCDTESPADPRVCCGPSAIRDAERVAAEIGVRHYVLGMHDVFEEEVVRHFVSEYSCGRTPNPCVRCNHLVKFEPLLEKAVALGASHLATGHHAVVRQDGTAFALHRPRDLSKDQTYFLFELDQRQLAAVHFPLGGLTKREVRAHARRLGLVTADKPESQEICFVPDGDCAGAVEAIRPGARPGTGELVDGAGRVIGRHPGIHRLTTSCRLSTVT